MFNQLSGSQNAGIQEILERYCIFHQQATGRIIDNEIDLMKFNKIIG
jgi:hypothetical protein